MRYQKQYSTPLDTKNTASNAALGSRNSNSEQQTQGISIKRWRTVSFCVGNLRTRPTTVTSIKPLIYSEAFPFPFASRLAASSILFLALRIISSLRFVNSAARSDFVAAHPLEIVAPSGTASSSIVLSLDVRLYLDIRS